MKAKTRHRLLQCATALSLALLIAAVLLWIRSYHTDPIIADTPVFGVAGHVSGDVRPEYYSYEPGSVLGFVVRGEHVEAPFNYERFIIRIPLWFPLLLLLIAPIRWLIARPANAPAFPVVIDGMQSK